MGTLSAIVDAILNLPTYLGIFVLSILNMFVASIAWLCGMLMSLGLNLMEVSIDHFVVNMKQWIEIGLTTNASGVVTNPGVIQNGWNIVGNVANMIFIFALLFVAIATIVGLNYKRYLMTIVIAAVLVNFSLVTTKALVDLSNVAAIGFYNSTATLAASTTIPNLLGGGTHPASVGEFIKKQLDFDTKFSTTSPDRINFSNPNKPPPNSAAAKLQNVIDRIVTNFMKIFFHIVAAYVFYSITLLLITRFIVIVFLMILSPVAFASFPLPQMKSLIFSRWWGSLKNQLLIAPVFFFFFYIVIMMIDKFPSSSFQTSTFSASYSSILSFMIIIGLLIFALQASKELSDSTSNAITGMMRKGVSRTGAAAGRQVGRQVGGRIGKTVAGGSLATKLAANKNSKISQFAGRNMMRLGNTMEASSWGSGKGSFKSQNEERGKRNQKLNVQTHDNINAAYKREKKKKDYALGEKELIKKKMKANLGGTALTKEEEEKHQELFAKTKGGKKKLKKSVAKRIRNIGSLEKEEERLSVMKESYEKNLKEKSKQTSAFSAAPVFGTKEKAYKDAHEEITKKETSAAAKEAREKKKGEEYKGAKEVEAKLEKAIAGDKGVEVLKELQKMNKNQIKIVKHDLLKHKSVAPYLSRNQLKEVSKDSSQKEINDMHKAIKEVAKDLKNPAQANAQRLVDHIKRQNGPKRS
ncbi:MAG: hypothetical protein KAS07_01290 [Candidatus Pacebacteria bacterium]|nr:hypothetical protein [Candidatus Paceibacterota bacterium]